LACGPIIFTIHLSKQNILKDSLVCGLDVAELLGCQIDGDAVNASETLNHFVQLCVERVERETTLAKMKIISYLLFLLFNQKILNREHNDEKELELIFHSVIEFILRKNGISLQY